MTIHGPEPYEFNSKTDIHGPEPYQFIGTIVIHHPEPYEFIGKLPQTPAVLILTSVAQELQGRHAEASRAFDINA